MFRVDDFRLYSIQAAIFTPSRTDKFRTTDIIGPVLAALPDRFDGEIESAPPIQPQSILEIPGQVAEFGVRFGPPSVLLTSRDGQWKFQATPARADSIWNRKADPEPARTLNDLRESVVEPLRQYPLRNEGVQKGRLALVVRRFAFIDQPAKQLSTWFCLPELVDEGNRTAPFRRSETFKVENLKKYDSPHAPVNSWVRCSSGVVDDQPCVIVEQDINTFSESTAEARFDVAQIESFFDWAPNEVDRILDLYFGDRGRVAGR